MNERSIKDPSQLKTISVLTPWIVFFFLFSFTILFFSGIWIFFGRIPVIVEGKGIIISKNGLVKLQSAYKGVVSQVYLEVGDQIKKDKPLIEIQNEEGTQTVSSPFQGELLERYINDNNTVTEGSPLFWYEVSPENSSDPFIIYSFVPVDMGKRISKGMPVEMIFETINYNEFGALEGHVHDISKFAVSQVNILNEIQNQEIVRYLTDNRSAVFEVIIKPTYDSIEKKFKWTSGKEPLDQLTTGLVGLVKIKISDVRPLYYFLPIPELKIIESNNKL